VCAIHKLNLNSCNVTFSLEVNAACGGLSCVAYMLCLPVALSSGVVEYFVPLLNRPAQPQYDLS
jgi:hypothetical protein